MATWMLAELEIREDRIPKTLRGMTGNVEDGLYRLGEEVREEARSRAPKDTGALAESIAVTTQSKSDVNQRVAQSSLLRENEQWASATSPPPEAVDIHATIRYATYIELGTTRNGAQPFLQPALATVNKFLDNLRNILDG